MFDDSTIIPRTRDATRMMFVVDTTGGTAHRRGETGASVSMYRNFRPAALRQAGRKCGRSQTPDSLGRAT
jgi:hypothetical protein